MRLQRLLATFLFAATVSASAAASTLKPYRDDAELASALDRWRAASQTALRERARLAPGLAQSMAAPAPISAPVAAAKPAADSASPAGESITNLQSVLQQHS